MLVPCAPAPLSQPSGAAAVNRILERLVPLLVTLVVPPNAPELLYCTVLAAPPGVPPPPQPTVPLSTWLPFTSMLTQCPLVCVPVVVTNCVVLPERVPTVGAAPGPPPMTGRLAVKAAEEANVVALAK